MEDQRKTIGDLASESYCCGVDQMLSFLMHDMKLITYEQRKEAASRFFKQESVDQFLKGCKKGGVS